MLNKRLEILWSIFPDSSFQESKMEFITWCPSKEPGGCNGQHHKRKLQINIEKNTFNCWVCGYSGFIYKLLRDHASRDRKDEYMRTVDDFVPRDDEVPDQILEPPEFCVPLLAAQHIDKAVRSLEWLRREAGASDETVFQSKIQYCTEGINKGRIVFPSFDTDGNLNFYQTRDIDRKDRLKYINCERKIKDIVFNEILVNWKEPIIIVESIKTFLRHRMIPNIVPILGTRFHKRYSLFRKSVLNDTPKVYVALDSEAISKAYEIMDYYHSCGVEVRLVDVGEDNQPDSISTERFLDRMVNSVTFSRKDKILSKIKRIRNSL